LKDFVEKNKETIHDLLNHLWMTIEQLHLRFNKEIPNCDLQNFHGNFIQLGDGWDEATYPNPVVSFPYGEFGYSLDGLYGVLSLKKNSLDEKCLLSLVKKQKDFQEVHMELYGGADCFQTFYSSTEEFSLDDILTALEESEEEVIQLEINLPGVNREEVAKEELIQTFLAIYTFLKQKECLEKLPGY
jgi:hypothetical protein